MIKTIFTLTAVNTLYIWLAGACPTVLVTFYRVVNSSKAVTFTLYVRKQAQNYANGHCFRHNLPRSKMIPPAHKLNGLL